MTNKNKAPQPIKKSYKKILGQIQEQISITQDEIFKTVTRKKVEMAWHIGRIVDSAISHEREKDYGKQLIERLERDTSIGKTVLYKMQSFYQNYPKLPQDDPKLNWSHYRVLSGIKKAEERKVLENLARENSWDSDELQKQASFKKGGGSLSRSESETEDFGDELTSTKSPSDANASPPPFSKGARQIEPNRGKVFAYKIVKIAGSDKNFIDCGFKIFREEKEKLPHDVEVVLASKKGEGFSFKKSALKTNQVYVYKAYLNRVVDGDTIHANIDLGFGMWHEEILRLAKINAVEAKSEAGGKAKEELQKILESAPFFVIKSIKTDIFNRYVADVFLPNKKNETDLQKIADEGTYLNQLLLDRGLAEIF